jgi:hypothetical protein
MGEFSFKKMFCFVCTRHHICFLLRHSRFLFGTCCLLSGDIETSLANVKSNISQTTHDKAATKEPMFMSTKAQVINNQFYGADPDNNNLYEDTQFEVSNEAVVVSSPAYPESPSYYPTESTIKKTQYVASHSYSTELPTRIYSTTTSSSEEANDLTDSVQFSKVPYDHSDISYSPSDSEILMEGYNHISHYPMSTLEPLYTDTRTEATEKHKYSKPIFKLKPTQSYASSTEKYVLVHTISNDKEHEENQENPTKKPTTNESIQSIIMMLNGSNPGPEYNVNSMSVDNSNNYISVAVSSTPSYESTTMIDREKYGSSSYYVTTKLPNRPSTGNDAANFVYSLSSTKRPNSKTTTQKTVNKVKVTPTRLPLIPTTPPNVPSTSYVYSPNPIRKRPTTASVTSSTPATIKKGTTNIIKKTTPKPSLIVKQPSPDIQSNYVVISGASVTKYPSPTVHITPKPITNLLTSSTPNQTNNKQTKKPTKSSSPTPAFASVSTERPPFYGSSTPGTFVSSSIFVPAIQDFHNEGYFVVTHRPDGSVSSTAVYTVNSGILNSHPQAESGIKIPGGVEHDPVNFNDEVPAMNNDDFSNFPPVRNPNLNMTATNMIMDESEISTPLFVEDEQLSSKIDLLVNKLVASMQGNLENLVDIVYERKNITTAEQDISNLNKNGTLSENAKPVKTTVKPSNVKVTTKAPARVTTGRPSQQTTKKAPTKAATTKKPSTATKKPTARPATTQSTKKPPARVTTTAATKKPTRKVTTTERAPVEDELVEEEGDENSETVEENDEDNVVEESENDGSTPAPLENGRIRKNPFH